MCAYKLNSNIERVGMIAIINLENFLEYPESKETKLAIGESNLRNL